MREALTEVLHEQDVGGLHLAGAGSAAEHERLRARIDALVDRVGDADGPSFRGLLMRLEARIEIAEDALTLSVGRNVLAGAIGALIDPNGDEQRITTTRPLLLRKRGVETKLVLGEVDCARPDPVLVRLLTDAHDWMQELREGQFASIRALARDLGLDHRQVARTLPLAFLAPDIVTAIVEGRQSVDLTARKLERIGDLPLRWDGQRIAVGMANGA